MERKTYLKENIVPIAIIILLGLLVYGMKLFTYSFSIDTEALLSNQEEILKSWISIGRYGLVLFKKIFDIAHFSLRLANVVGFILLIFSIMLCIYNINMITGKNNKIANIILGGIIITSPIIIEQFNFTLQCVEVSLALLLLNLSFTIINRCIINKNKYYWLIFAIIFMVISFGCYQAFIPLMITFSTFYIMLFFKEKDERKISIIIKYIVVFVVSIILYKIIDKIFMNIYNIHQTLYLSSQILWGTDRKLNIIKTILKSIGKLLLAKTREHYNLGLLFCIIGFIPFAFKDFKLKNWIFYISVLTFFISPFLLIIITGGEPTARTMFSITFATALGAYFIYNYTNKNILKSIIMLIFSSVIIYQMIISIKFLCTDYNVFGIEKQLANDLEIELKIINKDNKPIAFVGPFSADGDSIFLKGEVMGWTFFEWDQGSPMDSNIRISGFLKQLGYDNKIVSNKQYKEAKEKAKEMSVYPKDGCIREEKDYIIIKLNN